MLKKSDGDAFHIDDNDPAAGTSLSPVYRCHRHAVLKTGPLRKGEDRFARRFYIGSDLPLKSEEGVCYFRIRLFLTDLTPPTLRATFDALSRV